MHEVYQDLTSCQKRKETNSWTDCTELHITHSNELQGLTSTSIEMTSKYAGVNTPPGNQASKKIEVNLKQERWFS
jgi:hypothetical protein